MASHLPPTPLEALRVAWRWLRTMRTALILLLLLAAGSAVGSLFPQRPILPSSVDAWSARNPGWAPWAEHLGLFDVYGSWWFMTIYVLLLVSVVGCIGPRYRAFARALRSRPRLAPALEAQPQYTAGLVATSPDGALASAERVLRSRRFRSVRADGLVAGEKGHWREGGSLVFHTAFLVLLVGMSLGKFFGFSGQVAIVEGDSFTDAHVAYDSITEGRYFRERHRGFTLDVEKFDVTWWPNGVPREFVSTVRLSDAGREVRGGRISVNHPLGYRGVKIYQLSWGWAPVVRVEQNGRVLYDGPTILLPQGAYWHGVVKLAQTKPQQMGIDLYFFTDPQQTASGEVTNGSPEARNPVLLLRPYAGDLNLSVPQSVYELDYRGLTPLGEGTGVRPGDRTDLPNGVIVSFPALRKFTVFQIASNPGAPVLLAAGILILVALVPALYSSRRRVWVRAAAREGVARLEIAGHALQRKAAFEEEFRSLVRDLDRDLAMTTGARDA